LIDSATAIASTNALAFDGRGTTYQAKGDMARANADFEEARKLARPAP